MNRQYYDRLLDDLGRETIARYDREESGRQCFGTDEAAQGNGLYTFSALDRDKQVDILHALDVNLPTRTKRPNRNTGTSYAIKHAVERYTGFYCSNLQAKTALRVLGYERGGDGLNPNYNITRREWRHFSDVSRRMANERAAARRRATR